MSGPHLSHASEDRVEDVGVVLVLHNALRGQPPYIELRQRAVHLRLASHLQCGRSVHVVKSNSACCPATFTAHAAEARIHHVSTRATSAQHPQAGLLAASLVMLS